MIVRLGRRYGFPASHRLFNPALDDAANRALFGKCANPHGHGHNYEVELTVRGQVDPVTGRAVDLGALDALVEQAILAPFRYRNLNEEVPVFREAVPTTENLALEVLRRLREAWPGLEAGHPAGVVLEKLRIWETERNICELSATEL